MEKRSTLTSVTIEIKTLQFRATGRIQTGAPAASKIQTDVYGKGKCRFPWQVTWGAQYYFIHVHT